jgi:ribosome-binding factor A
LKPQRPFKRTDRVKEQILQIITDTATKHIDLSPLGFITFTNIVVSPDFRSAKINYSVLNPTLPKKNINVKLNHKAKGFKKYLGMELRIKNIPDIQFFYDDSYDYAEKMSQKIQNLGIPSDDDTECL